MSWPTKYVLPFLLGWMTSFSMASLFHSLFVVNGLIQVGVVITTQHIIEMCSQDWMGLLPTYGIIIAVGLGVGLGSTQLAISRFNLSNVKRIILFALSGLFAIAVILLAMKPIMHITLVAGARGIGFYAQISAGFIGGLVAGITQYCLTKKRSSTAQ